MFIRQTKRKLSIILLMLNIKEINDAKHIVIVLPNNASVDYLASSNALYTYFLQLHKKVSFYCEEFEYDLNLNFLPWMDKLKSSYPSSSDYEIKAISSQELFHYFTVKQIKLNYKMSTSLYAGLLDFTKAFSKEIDGTIFAHFKVLVDNGADVKLCNNNLINYQTYASLRLKAILLTKMKLEDDAKKAIFELNEDDLKKSGANIKDAKSVLLEALALPTVNLAVVIYKNKEIMRQGNIS